MTQDRQVDVAIAGGSIAGATLGAVLAGAGLDVVIVEREGRFRDKVRGEGIHPWGYREAKRLGLDPALHAAGAVELPIWQTYSDRKPDEPYLWSRDEANGLPEVTVFHPALQQALIEYAAEMGATVIRPGRVTGVQREKAPGLTVDINGRQRTVRARLVAGADGRTSAVRRWIGAEALADPAHHLFGGALLGGASLPAGATHGTTFAGGRMFAFPQGNGLARAYVVGTAELLAPLQGARNRDRYAPFCASVLPEGMLDGAEPIGPIAFFPNNDVWASRIGDGDVVLIGDAAGANDPSVGQGLSLVFRDVRELRDLLLNGRDWRAATREFARRRCAYFDVLRQHAMWLGMLTVETGPEAEARREQVAKAREVDPTAGGFAMIFARGPDGLVADESARRRFFGEDAG